MWKVVRTVALDWLEEEAAGGSAVQTGGGQANGGGNVQGVYEEY